MLGAHLLAILAVAVAVSLGLWQYDAWQERRAAEQRDLTDRPPVPLAEVFGPDDPIPGDYVGQPVTATGTWVEDGTVLISGREHDGVEGYWVVTPLLVDGSAALPVVRGWSESGTTPPPAGSEPVRLTAWLQPPDGTGDVDPDPTDDVFPQLRTADLIQRVDVDLYNGYAVDQVAGPGLVVADLEELPEVSATNSLRNLLYALEWWVFAGFAGFIWWRFVRDARAESTTGDPVVSGA